MRRIRHTSAGLSPTPLSRPVAAFALSAAFHVLLIHGLALPARTGSQALVTVMQVRLEPASAPRVRSPISAPSAATGSGADFGAQPPARILPVMMRPGLSPPTAQPQPISESPGSAAEDGHLTPSHAVETPSVLLADPVHYAARDLDIFPRTKSPIAPAFPNAAIAAGNSGFVTLHVLIDEAGRVVRADVVDAAPDGMFEEAAQRAITEAAFYPAQKDGRIVRSRVLVRIEFDPASVNAAR